MYPAREWCRKTYIYCSCVIFITRFIKPSLANSGYRVPSVVAGAIVLFRKLHCALRESDGRIKDKPKWNFQFFSAALSLSQDVIFYLWTIQKFAFYRRSHCIYPTLSDLWGNRNSLTVHILWHVNLHCVLHNISQFSLPVSCRFMHGKVGENDEALFTFFSKYKLFVYGIELWKTARPIYFLFDLCGLKLSAINDAPDLMEICLNWYQDNKQVKAKLLLPVVSQVESWLHWTY